jgi:hypothetical protein
MTVSNISNSKTIFHLKNPRANTSWSFVKKIFKNIRNFAMPTIAFTSPLAGEVKTIDIHLKDFASNITHPNKIVAYHTLTEGIPPSEIVHLSKKSLDLKAEKKLSQKPIFEKPSPCIKHCPGVFTYTQSTPISKHWTVNFADFHLFGYCQGALLAQDELQALEHPGIYHLKTALENLPNFKTIASKQAALIENIYRRGSLDAQTPLSSGRSLYGNTFATASKREILSRLQKIQPYSSNLVAMAAPSIPEYLEGQPYQKRHLEELFYTAYTAFSAIKQKSGSDHNILHTGNWGAGAFGNDPKVVAIIQLAAARLAGLDEVRYYPMNSRQEFEQAKHLLTDIEAMHQGLAFSVDDFLTYLANNAKKLCLFYGKGNGT